MKYNKPMILATTPAASAIMGQKMIAVVDNDNPTSPLQSVTAYSADE